MQKAITEKGGVWADLGAGEGAFTLALRDLAGPDVTIYSIDQDGSRLQAQKKEFGKRFPHTNIQFIESDFTKPLNLPLLDGVVMANSLHYIEDHISFLKKVNTLLKPHGKLVLVEYSIDSGNEWVPFPLSFPTFEREAHNAGFSKIALLEKIPSTYWDEMYSAVANKI
jgi:ubiquinone/menaquinone biosynthesis C-methylase UbiE